MEFFYTRNELGSPTDPRAKTWRGVANLRAIEFVKRFLNQEKFRRLNGCNPPSQAFFVDYPRLVQHN